MTHFMAYVILLSAGVAACALIVELLLQSRTASTRWAWLAALAAMITVAGFVTFAPLPRASENAIPQAVVPDSVTAGPLIATPQPGRAEFFLRVADLILPGAWLLSSLFLLVAIVHGQRRLIMERTTATRVRLSGRDVLLTDNVGPAVAGIGQPVVFLPRWVLALDEPSQELLLAHEFEHVNRGDTRALLMGAVAVALIPWNPLSWWAARRLRFAVEQDCDARVLRSHPDVRRYADLLLTAASKPRVATTLLAAHLGESRSDLDGRIQAMTDKRMKWRPLFGAAAIATLLVVTSCEAPRPEPLAPRKADEPEKTVVGPNAVLYEFQVEKPAALASGSISPKYPDILRQAGVEGDVLVAFVVNEDGTADVATFKVIKATHELFATAVKTALPSMRFVAAEVGGKKVKQMVQQPFSFDIARVDEKVREVDATLESVKKANEDFKRLAFVVTRDPRPEEPPRVEIEKANAGPKRLAFTVDRGQRVDEVEVKKSPATLLYRVESMPSEPVNFELLSSRGDVVSRYTSSRMPKEVRNEDIASIEVFKPKGCAANGSACPLIRITLKPGTEGAYRQK